MKRSLRYSWPAVAALCACSFLVPAFGASAVPFANGADIGWLSQFEAKGIRWRNPAGVLQDPLRTLADQGINAIRLRVFVNPPADGMVNGYPLGFCDEASVVAMAVRARQAGFHRLMIDFHYSDTWADPGKQPKPAAWADHSIDQLVADVYQHTHHVMQALAEAGIHPEWVQVGNEINGGMLWPEGSTRDFGPLTRLINSGYDAVKAVSPESKVVVHVASGHDNALFRWWFDEFTRHHGKFDVIGLSYYPYWVKVDFTQNIAGLRDNLNDMARRYGKEVMVCEVGGLESDPSNSYALVRATIAAVKAVPDGKGLGVFYWEPEADSTTTGGYALGAATRVSPQVLQFTEAIRAFAADAPSTPPQPASVSSEPAGAGRDAARPARPTPHP